MKAVWGTLAGVTVLLIGACTGDDHGSSSSAAPLRKEIVLDTPLPAPGATQVLSVTEITDVANCATRRKPLLRVDPSSITPPSVRPGSMINHQLVYTLCGRSPAPVRGTMTTVISSREDKVFTNTLHDYELKPGRWIVNTNIGIPTDVKPGTYQLDTAFKSKAVTFKDSAAFAVEPQVAAARATR